MKKEDGKRMRRVMAAREQGCRCGEGPGCGMPPEKQEEGGLGTWGISEAEKQREEAVGVDDWESQGRGKIAGINFQRMKGLQAGNIRAGGLSENRGRRRRALE